MYLGATVCGHGAPRGVKPKVDALLNLVYTNHGASVLVDSG